MNNNEQTVKRIIVASSKGVRKAADGGIEVCCVSCATWKTLPHFGLRYMTPREEMRTQSWCIQCRAEGRAQ